jgi:hypothetical protein
LSNAQAMSKHNTGVCLATGVKFSFLSFFLIQFEIFIFVLARLSVNERFGVELYIGDQFKIEFETTF